MSSSSIELCRESFAAEGASPAEIESEVALIKTQLAFVKQMKGDVDGALSDYRNVLKLKCVLLTIRLLVLVCLSFGFIY